MAENGSRPQSRAAMAAATAAEQSCGKCIDTCNCLASGTSEALCCSTVKGRIYVWIAVVTGLAILSGLIHYYKSLSTEDVTMPCNYTTDVLNFRECMHRWNSKCKRCRLFMAKSETSSHRFNHAAMRGTDWTALSRRSCSHICSLPGAEAAAAALANDHKSIDQIMSGFAHEAELDKPEFSAPTKAEKHKRAAKIDITATKEQLLLQEIMMADMAETNTATDEYNFKGITSRFANNYWSPALPAPSTMTNGCFSAFKRYNVTLESQYKPDKISYEGKMGIPLYKEMVDIARHISDVGVMLCNTPMFLIEGPPKRRFDTPPRHARGCDKETVDKYLSKPFDQWSSGARAELLAAAKIHGKEFDYFYVPLATNVSSNAAQAVLCAPHVECTVAAVAKSMQLSIFVGNFSNTERIAADWDGYKIVEIVLNHLPYANGPFYEPPSLCPRMNPDHSRRCLMHSNQRIQRWSQLPVAVPPLAVPISSTHPQEEQAQAPPRQKRVFIHMLLSAIHLIRVEQLSNAVTEIQKALQYYGPTIEMNKSNIQNAVKLINDNFRATLEYIDSTWTIMRRDNHRLETLDYVDQAFKAQMTWIEICNTRFNAIVWHHHALLKHIIFKYAIGKPPPIMFTTAYSEFDLEVQARSDGWDYRIALKKHLWPLFNVSREIVNTTLYLFMDDADCESTYRFKTRQPATNWPVNIHKGTTLQEAIERLTDSYENFTLVADTSRGGIYLPVEEMGARIVHQDPSRAMLTPWQSAIASEHWSYSLNYTIGKELYLHTPTGFVIRTNVPTAVSVKSCIDESTLSFRIEPGTTAYSFLPPELNQCHLKEDGTSGNIYEWPSSEGVVAAPSPRQGPAENSYWAQKPMWLGETPEESLSNLKSMVENNNTHAHLLISQVTKARMAIMENYGYFLDEYKRIPEASTDNKFKLTPLEGRHSPLVDIWEGTVDLANAVLFEDDSLVKTTLNAVNPANWLEALFKTLMAVLALTCAGGVIYFLLNISCIRSGLSRSRSRTASERGHHRRYSIVDSYAVVQQQQPQQQPSAAVGSTTTAPMLSIRPRLPPLRIKKSYSVSTSKKKSIKRGKRPTSLIENPLEEALAEADAPPSVSSSYADGTADSSIESIMQKLHIMPVEMPKIEELELRKRSTPKRTPRPKSGMENITEL
jgi:hypothetical protein